MLLEKKKNVLRFCQTSPKITSDDLKKKKFSKHSNKLSGLFFKVNVPLDLRFTSQ